MRGCDEVNRAVCVMTCALKIHLFGTRNRSLTNDLRINVKSIYAQITDKLQLPACPAGRTQREYARQQTRQQM